MRVGLLADRLDRGERRTGFCAYIEGLAHGLDEVPTDDRFVVFDVGTHATRNGFEGRESAVSFGTLSWPRRATILAWALSNHPRIRDMEGPLDLLHVLTPTVPVPTAVPLVVTVHDLMPLKYPHLWRRRPQIMFADAMRRFRRSARWVIAISEATRRDVVELLGFPEERTTVVHHGLPVHFASAPAAAQDAVRQKYELGENPVLLFVGAVAERKNVVRLVDAFAHLAHDVLGVRLVLAGSPGIGYDRLIDRIRATGLSGSITVTGHAPQGDVEALMATARGLVLPSLDEGFGFPALEAMSVGTPVIASTAGSLPEVVGDAGLLVSPIDADAIAAAMHRLITDDGLRETLSRRSKERAATFTWRRAAEQTLETYGHALGG